ncbi:putative holin [Halomonas sp. RA08-2]|uniref:putative holin n=1 Tax=Halomonas sp. RA08-2 TaxID=3440842 RepID=UPI003EEDB0DD
MAEPSTAVAAGTISLTAALIALLPGVEPDAAIGAFCGALLFFISGKQEFPLWMRIAYLPISFVIGYLGGPSLLGDYIEATAVSAFIGASITVTAGIRVIEGVRTLDLKAWFGSGGKK